VGLEPGEVAYASVPKHTPVTETAEPLNASNTYSYPNPCGDRATIRFSLDKPQETDIMIMDISGRPVWRAVLGEEKTLKGINRVEWETINDRGVKVANGIYYYRVTAGSITVTKKIAVVR